MSAKFPRGGSKLILSHPSTSFAEAKLENNKQNAFITAESSFHNIVDIVQNHANNCASEIKLNKLIYRGHVAIVTLNCGGPAIPIP